MGEQQISATSTYKYLGVWFNDTCQPAKHRKAIKAKGAQTSYLLKRLYTNLPSPSAKAILRVINAKVLPTLAYGHLAYPGKLAQLIDNTAGKIYKGVFGIKKYARQSRVRAEFGFTSFKILEMTGFINYYLSLVRSPPNILKHTLRHLFDERGSPWYEFLKTSIRELEIVEEALGNTIIPLPKWKEVLSREAKIKSLILDIQNQRHSLLSDSTNNSYLIGRPQPYLLDALNPSTRLIILNLRLHAIALRDFNPKWESFCSVQCVLCHTSSQSWAHLLCICPVLKPIRVKLLKPIFLARAIKTVQQAMVLCFSELLTTSELARIAKFANQMELAIKRAKSN